MLASAAGRNNDFDLLGSPFLGLNLDIYKVCANVRGYQKT